MNLTMEKSQENIKLWLQGSENIYNYNLLTYPSIEQQAYILEQNQLMEQFKKYQNQQDLQKNLLPYCDQHKAIIYAMFSVSKQQRTLFDLMNFKGFHNILAFYQEFSIFINTQFHLLKENLKGEIFSIMRLFLENPLEQLEECFKSFLRIGVICCDGRNLAFFKDFLKFLLEQTPQIINKPNLAALLFYKYLLILNVDEFYRMQKFPIQEINKYLLEIWQLHQPQIMMFGRELLINLQIPIQYSELPAPLLDLNIIKQSLKSSHLIADMTTTIQSYNTNYQLLLPYEIEQRVTFAVFQQINIESVQTSINIILEKYGYEINFIGAIVRNLICLHTFDDAEIILNKIAIALYLIYDIADLKGEKWPIYLRFIFSDIFLMTKDFKNDHNVQPGLYFLSYLHKRQLYDELQSALWFIFQTFESNDQLKRKVQPQLLSFSSHILFKKLYDDQIINVKIKHKIFEYFLKLLCTQTQGSDELNYQEQQPAIYSVDDLDTPQVIPQQQQQSDEVSLFDLQTRNMVIEEQDQGFSNYMEIDIFVQKILEKEKLDIIFMNPQIETNLIKLLTFFNKSVQHDVKCLFVTELTKILLKLYEDQFYDIYYEYEFNCLQTLLKINFNEDSLLLDLFNNIIKQEPFCLNYLFLLRFEQKTHLHYLEKLIFSSFEQIQKCFQTCILLLPQQRINNILEQLLSTQQIYSNVEFTMNLLFVANIQSVQKIVDRIRQLFIRNYLFIVQLLKKISISETTNIQGLLIDMVLNIIMENENQKDMNIILEQVCSNFDMQNKKFWINFQKIFQYLLQYKRVTEECLIQFFTYCFSIAQQQVEGISEVFFVTPNTIKSLIGKSLTKFLDKTKNYEAIEIILKHLSKDSKNIILKNSIQMNFDAYIKSEKK